MGFKVTGWVDVKMPIMELTYSKVDKGGRKQTWELGIDYSKLPEAGRVLLTGKSFRFYTDSVGAKGMTLPETDAELGVKRDQLLGLAAVKSKGMKDPVFDMALTLVSGEYKLSVHKVRAKVKTREHLTKLCGEERAKSFLDRAEECFKSEGLEVNLNDLDMDVLGD